MHLLFSYSILHRVRIWDVAVLLPNLLFLFHLLSRLKYSLNSLRRNQRNYFVCFAYALIWIDSVVSVLRCLVSMILTAFIAVGHSRSSMDRLLWIFVRFFLLSTEMFVLVFSFVKSFRRERRSLSKLIFGLTLASSLFYSMIQATLEFLNPDDKFFVVETDSQLFAHGGMGFWQTTCIILSALYFIAIILPWTPCKRYAMLPGMRQSFDATKEKTNCKSNCVC